MATKSSVRRCGGLILLAAVAAVAPAAAATPGRALILTGNSDEPFHHWRETTASIREILERTGRFDVRVVEDARAITPDALAAVDVLVLNYNGPRLGAAAEQAIERFVANGGGFAAFHQACYGEFFGMRYEGKWRAGSPGQAWAAYPKILGAQWAPEKIGHARRTAFPVEWRDRQHPIARGLDASFMANDELYHRLTLAPDTHVIADALSPKEMNGTGEREPLIWTHSFGKGRVFFTTLGHDAAAFYQSGFRTAFARGIEWAATGEATIAPFQTHPQVDKSAIRMLVTTGGHAYPTAFYAMLDSLPGVQWTHATSQQQAYAKPLEQRYDILLLHDMELEASEQAKARLQAFVEAGKGVIVLHHAVCAYQNWPWWHEEVVGGWYFQKGIEGHTPSTFKEDVEYFATPVKGKERHPVLKGVGPLWVFDEMYHGMWISPRITPLMEVDNPGIDKPVVYIGPHQKARVLYIQIGHSAHTMAHPGFRKLMANATQWVARKVD